jgi:hypothetical protein
METGVVIMPALEDKVYILNVKSQFSLYDTEWAYGLLLKFRKKFLLSLSSPFQTTKSF